MRYVLQSVANDSGNERSRYRVVGRITNIPCIIHTFVISYRRCGSTRRKKQLWQTDTSNYILCFVISFTFVFHLRGRRTRELKKKKKQKKGQRETKRNETNETKFAARRS